MTVNGATLANDPEYVDISKLSGDKLKTAILEKMLDQLNGATAQDFREIRSNIIQSPAYVILGTSQSRFATMKFFKGTTSSQNVIDRLIAERAQALGVDLQQPRQNGPMNTNG